MASGSSCILFVPTNLKRRLLIWFFRLCHLYFRIRNRSFLTSIGLIIMSILTHFLQSEFSSNKSIYSCFLLTVSPFVGVTVMFVIVPFFYGKIRSYLHFD